MNVVALAKIVTWLCDIYLSLLICFVNYEMFLIMQLNLTCRSFRRTSNDSLEEEPKDSQVKNTVAKKELHKNIKRTVDPPQEMKTTLDTRNNPR